MTPLNTIIEEEKKKLFDHIEKLEHGIQQWNGLNVWEAGEMDDHADLITTAMQRAYEAGAEAERDRIFHVLGNLVPKDGDAIDVINDWIIPELKRLLTPLPDNK